MKTELIVARLEEILRHFDLSAAAFADKINVQRSSISHLLKGRNKPSLEFILKVVEAFPEVDLYWLLYGRGAFPCDISNSKEVTTTPVQKEKMAFLNLADHYPKTIDRIVIFYEDGTFKSYNENH